MSRIQNILNKAERDGTVRRIHSAAEPTAAACARLSSRACDREGEVATAGACAREVATAGDLGAMTGSAAVAAPASVMAEIGASDVSDLPPATPACALTVQLDPQLVVALDAKSTAAEQYRALRTRIAHADTGGPVTLLLVTSPGRNEGKTLTAANLALTMAQEYQQRVCVVDADLRNPRMHELFGLPDTPGLADVVAGRAALEEALVTVENYHISVLPAGDAGAHPAELLGTGAMRRMLDTLRSQFDRVVIDAPSAAPLADVGILTPLVDSVLLVVRAGVTSKPAIQEAVHGIDQAKLLGLVLNEAA
jgi:capsular exopolysaccharide synthesis family protein